MIEEHSERKLEARAEAALAEQSKLMQVGTHPMVQLLLGSTPWTGGLAGAMGSAIQRRQEVRLREFLISLANDIAALGNQLSNSVDMDFLYSDEYAAIFENVMQEASRTADEEKCKALKSVLLCSAYKYRPDVTWQQLLVGYLRSLTGTHLRVLKVFYDVQGRSSRADRFGRVRVGGTIPLGLAKLSKKMPLTSKELLRISCADLATLGLIVDWRSLGGVEEKFQEEYVLSDNGLLLMKFVHGDWNMTPKEEVKL